MSKRITPFQNVGRPGYVVRFLHPLIGRVISRGLKTKDKNVADVLCRRLEQLCDARHMTADAALAAGIDPRAVRVYFKHEAPSNLLTKILTGKFNRDTADKRASLLGFAGDVGNIDIVGQILENTDAGAVVNRDELTEIIGAFGLRQHVAELEQRVRGQDDELTALRPRVEDLEFENRQHRQQLNKHVKVKVSKAVATWFAGYRATEKTRKDAKRAVDKFVTFYERKGNRTLADVSGGDVDAWLGGLELSTASRRNHRAYLSVFLSWAQRHFKLTRNPLVDAARIKASSTADKIEAIHRHADLCKYLAAFKRHPYWSAWVHVACLAGLRYTEQVRMKLDDVDLEAGELRILAPKTRRFRRVPIERTLLLPVLTAHVTAQRKGKHGAEWPLFPSVVPGNPHKPRVKAPPGQWSDNGVWWDAFVAVRDKVKPKKKTPAYWKHGPRQWRHTFGTALGLCGWGSREICKVMGNSERVCDRFYVAATSAGTRWPLKFN